MALPYLPFSLFANDDSAEEESLLLMQIRFVTQQKITSCWLVPSRRSLVILRVARCCKFGMKLMMAIWRILCIRCRKSCNCTQSPSYVGWWCCPYVHFTPPANKWGVRMWLWLVTRVRDAFEPCTFHKIRWKGAEDHQSASTNLHIRDV